MAAITPPTPPLRGPPPSWEQMASYGRAQQDARGRAAGSMLAVGALIHFLTVPIALVLFKALVESQAGTSITWDELWNALNVTGYMTLIVLGVGAQIVFGVVAAAGSLFAFRGSSTISIPLIVSGVIGLIFSIVVFGGIVGLIGGVVTAAGGARAKRPAPTMGLPPPYRPPTPPWG